MVLMAKLAHICTSQETQMPPNRSFRQLKSTPPTVKPAITSINSTGLNQPDIIATW